jgi:PAS domain S-box-containing protein
MRVALQVSGDLTENRLGPPVHTLLAGKMTIRRAGDAVSTGMTGREAIAADPEELQEELLPLLVERVRAGLWILLLAGPVFTIGDILYHQVALGQMLVLKGAYFAAVATGFVSIRRAPPSWRRCVVTSLLVMAAVEFVLSVSDVLVADRPTTFLLVSLTSMVTAAILPWGAGPQAMAALIAWAAIGWNAVLIPGPEGTLDPTVIAAVSATLVSVYVASVFHRQRVARRRAEIGLRESEELKGAILDAALDAIVAVDARGNIVAFNPAAERLFGIPAASAIGRDLAVWLTAPAGHEADRQWLRRGLTAVDGGLAGRTLETTAVRGDGSVVPVELAVTTSPRRGAPLFPVFVRDLTERRLAEEAQASAALVRVGQEMMQLLDTALVVERLNGIVQDVLRTDRVTTLLRDPESGAFVASGSGEGALPAAVVAPLLARLDDARLLVLGPASDRPSALAALCDEAQTVLMLALWHGDDVLGITLAACTTRTTPFTARERRVVQGIAQAASMALTNARLVEQLARASRIKSEFLSTMSHELRTPLNVVLGFAEMLADQELPEDERQQLRERITLVGRELLDLVDGALDIGKLEAGCSDVDVHPVSLPSFWSQMHARCALLGRRPLVVLDWSDEPPDVAVLTDVRKLSTIVRNLVGNALSSRSTGRCGSGWISPATSCASWSRTRASASGTRTTP